MGLDQYAGTLVETKDDESEAIIAQLVDNTIIPAAGINMDTAFSWRKHPNLQGWMEALWKSKGLSKTGEWNEFNCCPLELTKEDIICLKMDIESQDLPGTQGFFFGDDSDEYYKEQDLKFCDWALAEIEDGNKVIYDSWW
jgi:hypothetical protein